MASEQQQSFVREIVVDNELHFAAPASFNDPFDCCPLADLVATEDQYLAYWLEYLGDTPQRERKAREYARSLIKREPKSVAAALHAYEVALYVILHHNGAVCFNATALHQLMWSHYGDSHRGVCIQFDASNEFFQNVDAVSYVAERPKLNIFVDDMEALFRNAALSKSDVWRHEGEWRIVEADFVGNMPIPPEAITGVILGAKAGEHASSLIRDWVALRDRPIPIYQAQLHGHSYRVEVPNLPD